MIYQISDKLLCDLTEAENTFYKINTREISTKTSFELKQTALIDELFYFAKILGIGITFGEAKQIAVGKILDTNENPHFQLIHNYRSLLDFIKQNEQETTLNLLTHMNKLLGNGILEMWESGMLRNSTQEIKDEYDFVEGSKGSKDTTEGFIQEKSIPLANASKILRFVILNKPFLGLNDATALAGFSTEIMRLISDRFIFSPLKLLDEINLGSELSKQPEILLEDITNAAIAKCKEILQRIERENYDDSIRTKSKFLNLNERQLAALRYLENNLKISRKQYMKLFNVSTMTAFRDMNQLVEQKILTVEGKGRGTYYMLER